MTALLDIPGAAELVLDALAFARPPARLKASEWVEGNVVLPYSVSPDREGPLKLNKWQRDLIDIVMQDEVRSAALMLAAQTGKSTILCALILLMMSQKPGPAMFVHPREKDATMFVRNKLDPILNASPTMRGLMGAGGRKGGNDSLLYKAFPSGFLVQASSYIPEDLRAHSVRFMAMDEIDGFAGSAGREGDPVGLAEKRTHGFPETKKIILSSTPTTSTSRIAQKFDEGDQRRFEVPCPDCGAFDWLRLENLKWDKGQPETAHLLCSHCDHKLDNRERLHAMEHGRWTVTAQEPRRDRVSFHANILLSDIVSLSWIANAWEEHDTTAERKRLWVNTGAAEVYRADEGEPLDAAALNERAVKERVRAPYSADIAFVTLGVDVQASRIEVTALGTHERNGIATVMQHLRLPGDTSGHVVWNDLDAVLGASWPMAEGRELPVEITGIDSGFNTEMVAQFCKAQQAKGRRVVAIKGVSGFDKPAVRVSSNVLRGATTQFNIGVDVVKEGLMARLRMTEFGPGYIHLADHLDPSYFAGLAGEKIDTTHVRGYARRSFVKITRNNEPLDCLCYATAVATRVKLPEKTAPAQPTAREIGAAFNKLRQTEAEQTSTGRYNGS